MKMVSDLCQKPARRTNEAAKGTNVFGGNSSLFLLDISRDFQNFHTIEQRRGDGVERVGSTHEEHPRKIHRNLQ